MTTRLSGFIVTLESDMREDDAESTKEAIRHIKGVVDVSPVESNFVSGHAERMRLSVKAWECFREFHEKVFGK